MKKLSILFLSFIILGSFNLSAQKEKGIAVIGWYNLENLFDTEDDPITDDAQFLPEGSYRWTPERYVRKLDNMSKVISMIGEEYGGIVGIGLCELENRKVLEDLIATDNLKGRNLGIVHHNSPDRRGVDVGFIYDKDRFTVLHEKAYRLVTPDTHFRSRDQLLVTGLLDGIDTLSIIVNHWPSKLGGKKSIGSRNAAAELTRSICEELTKNNPNAKIIIVGDFNDDPDSQSILKVLGSKKKANKTEPGGLFNPMYRLYQLGYGSYAYRDAWGLIDQAIISYGLLHPAKGTYQYAAVKIFCEPLILQKTQTGSYEDYPYRTYAGGTYQGGYSDHFPIYVILKK